MISLKGKYQNGHVELLEPISNSTENIEVIVTFLGNINETLDEQSFWGLIDILNWNEESDFKIIAPLIEKLSTFSKDSICNFKEILSEKLYHLDTMAHAKEIGNRAYSENSHNFSPDIFLFARSLVVAKGKEFYNRVLHNPSLMPKNVDFELLLYAANDAYKVKTSEELKYIPKFIPETFFNKKGWGESFDPMKLVLG